MPDNKDGTGYIYLLKRHDGWYKIGRTAHVKNRFGQWRWMAKINRYKLQPILLVQVCNQDRAERIFHALFDEKRTNKRHNGMGRRHEWFVLDQADLETFLYWAKAIGEKIFYLNGNWTIPEGAR